MFHKWIGWRHVLLVACCLVLAGFPLIVLQRIHWPLLVLAEIILLGLALMFNPRYRALILIFMGVSLLFLAGGEIYLRVRYFGFDGLSIDRYRPASYGHPWSKFEYSEQTYTGLKPNTVIRFKGKLFSINADGFRGKTYLRPKPEGVFRIVLLGASATQGSGLKDAEVLTEVLETELNATGLPVRVEVVNLSLGGSRLGEMVHCLEAMGMSYEPDLILVGANQILIPAHQMEIKSRQVRSLDVPFWSRVFDRKYVFLGSRFFLINLLDYFKSGEIAGMGQVLARPAAGVRPAETLDMPEEQQRNLKIGLNHIRSVCGRIPVMLYLLRPVSNQAVLNDRAGYREYLARSAKDLDMIVLDTSDLDFSGYRELDLIVFPGDKHPNAIAHKLYADRMAGELAEFIRARARTHAEGIDPHKVESSALSD